MAGWVACMGGAAAASTAITAAAIAAGGGGQCSGDGGAPRWYLHTKCHLKELQKLSYQSAILTGPFDYRAERDPMPAPTSATTHEQRSPSRETSRAPLAPPSAAEK